MLKFLRDPLFAFTLLIFLAGCATSGVKDTEKASDHAQLEIPLPDPELEEIEEEPKEWLLPREAPVKEKGGRYAYLTFDDGPSVNTSRILDLLADYQIKGSFFFVGKDILENELLDYEDALALIRRTLSEGHFLGLHSMSHDPHRLYWSKEGSQNFYDEMLELQGLIYKITEGYETNLYRAPYGTLGMFTSEHIKKMSASGLKTWEWNIDTDDWKLETVNAILRKVRNDFAAWKNPDNAVILFHEHDITLEALPLVIKHFSDLGYTFLPYHPDNHFKLNLINNGNL